MNIIETRQLTRRYGRHDAVNGLDLVVPEGSVFALLGPNGAGKTTTIKVLVNLLSPSSGEARILGVDTRRLRPAEFEKIGYVSENQEMPDGMSVRQFLDYCRGFYSKWDSTLEATLLKQFELPLDRKLKHLSRGMRMKAALLSSLAYRPTLLILDEPFSGLDPIVRDEFVRGVLELAGDEGVTVFLSSHEIEEVERLADRVGIMNQGRMLSADTVETLQHRFRRMEADHATAALDPARQPKSWRKFIQQGARANWIDSDFGVKSEEACRALFPEAMVTAHPMTLKEIFVATIQGANPESGKAERR